MRLTELLKNKKSPTISFELFPARNDKAVEKLETVIDNLVNLNPDFVSVTFGAGGSTRDGSRQLVDKLKNEKALEVIAYFAGYGLGPDEISSVLNDYRDIGIETILIVRGDASGEDDSFKPHRESLAHASDMLSFVNTRYNFCLGAAGYPEGHIEADNKKKDLEFLKLKVDNGAQFIIANYCYNNQYFFDFVERCRDIGIHVPILAGIMPIYSVKMMEMLASLCGATITSEIRQGLEKYSPEDKASVEKFGIEFAAEQCRELIERGVSGLHIYTMDRAKTTVEIVNRLRNDRILT